MTYNVYGGRLSLTHFALDPTTLLRAYTTPDQGRLIQWARWARAQGPQALGAPKQPMR